MHQRDKSIDRQVQHAIGRAMGTFAMLQPQDRVAVGVSGGKDSLCLLHALVQYQRRAPFAFDIVAITIEQGKFKMPIAILDESIRRIGVRWILKEDRTTLDLVAHGVEHGCDTCSRHRRRHLYHTASEAGCSVLALGHTADDCAESLLRNILFNGRIGSLPPVAPSRKGALRLIRPLVYVTEDQTAEYVRRYKLMPVSCVCAEKDSVRAEIRRFLAELKSRHGGVPESIRAALGNVNLFTLFGTGQNRLREPVLQTDRLSESERTED